MINAFHHFAIISSSEESVSFYTNLGFKEYKRIERKNDTVVLMRGYGIEIEMFIDPSHPKRPTSPECIGLRHIALQVDNIENTLEQLKLKTEKIGNDWLGIRYCYVYDPDGLPIELHE